MIEQLQAFLDTYPLFVALLEVLFFFFLAWVFHRLSPWLARRLIGVRGITPQGKKTGLERERTLQSLIASAISVLAFTIAFLASLSLFVPSSTLLWVIGLFSIAFGWGARPIISDILASISFFFEDTFSVGEKVEILEIEGVIEAINLRTTYLRASTGELFVIPNGEIRVIRNFSRGRFSTAEARIKLAAADLGRTLPLLEDLGVEAVSLLPNLLEPWQVISEEGVIGQQTELTLLAKARFGKAAELRPRMLTLVQERLTAAEVTLVD